MAAALLGGRDDLREARVAFLVAPGAAWVGAQWGIWRAGGVAVPLAEAHPPPELARTLADAEPEFVLTDGAHAERLRAAGAADLLRVEDLVQGGGAAELPELHAGRRAMIIYTSGSTGRPKGVVTTHANIQAQVTALVQAWEWSAADRILHVLPLHHVHGVINVLTCALWSGACCEFLAPFDAAAVWERFASGEVTLFMAVPTIYRRLISAWEQAPPRVRRRWSQGARRLRLMVSGSAALPAATWERWREITGHRLLERYGMTEIGMALGNPLHGRRLPGTVGVPFPGVQARIVDGQGRPVPEGTSGEIEVRGPQVFLEYWRLPEETRAAFRDGWFRTGDEGVLEGGVWRIVGRRSVDIIKTGGYKVSALEIEEVLREHPAVADAAVVGVPDEEWGECVCAALVARAAAAAPAARADRMAGGEAGGAGSPRAAGPGLPQIDELRAWCKQRLAPYKAPRRLLWLPELPRNPLGKVLKPRLRELFAAERAP